MDATARNADSFRDKIPDILLLTGIFLLNFMGRVILAPLMPTIERDLQIGHAEAGQLFLMVSIGFFLTMAASGFINAVIGHRRTILLSAGSVGLALILVGLCRNLVTLKFSLIALGLGAGLYLPSAVATITDLAPARAWGRALAIHELAPNIGLISAPILAEVFLAWLPWQAVVMAMGGLSLAAGASFALFSRGGDFKGEAPKTATIGGLLKKPPVWILMGALSLGVGGSMGIFNILPLFMITERGMDPGVANTVLGISRVVGLFTAFVGGWMTDRFGEKRSIGVILLFSGLSTAFIGITSGWVLMAMIFVQAAFTASFFPPSLSAMARVGKPSERNVIVSCSMPLAYLIGGGAIPWGIGWMGEIGSFSWGIILAGLLILTGPFIIRFLEFHRDPA